MSLGDRLRQERERLALSQADMAALAGASRRSQISWEKGEAMPNAAYLAAIAARGADVQYVLSGIRTRDPALASALKASARASLQPGLDDAALAATLAAIGEQYWREALDLSAAEALLIRLYREVGAAAQAALLDMAGQMRNAYAGAYAAPSAVASAPSPSPGPGPGPGPGPAGHAGGSSGEKRAASARPAKPVVAGQAATAPAKARPARR